MELAKDLLVRSNSKNSLIYNSFTNSMCIVTNELYNCLLKDSSKWKNKIPEKDFEKLVKVGIVIEDYEEYVQKDFSLKYSRQCKKRKVCIETVYFHVTQRCNLNCTYCYNKARLNKTKELSIDEIEKLTDILENLNVKTVVLTGGEALLYDGIERVCALLKRKNFVIELLTNGVLLKNKKSVLQDVDHVIVSLDTLEQYNNHRVGLDINALLKTLITLEPEYRSKVSVRSVISKHNENTYKKVKDFCEENGYPFIPSVYIPNSLGEVKYMPEAKCFENNQASETRNIGGSYCGGGYYEIALDANGDIYPCQMFVKEKFKMGNIFELPNGVIELSEINERFMRRNLTAVNECKNCQYKYLCGGGCPAVSYLLFGDLNVAPKPVCDYLKIGINRKLERILDEYGCADESNQ